MLGKTVKVKVTKPCNSIDEVTGVRYLINYGIADTGTEKRNNLAGAYILGVNYPVRVFEGKVIAVLHYRDTKKQVLVVAPKKMRRIEYEIEDVLAFAEDPAKYTLECLYEHSCGAIVYRIIDGHIRFLLIKNNGSSSWGFPKGHRERGESKIDTAKREVLEEAGIHIDVIDGFCETSNYKIAQRIEKRVDIFLASTKDTQTVIQEEEIEKYSWLLYDAAVKQLNFENDKNMLASVKEFMTGRGLWL